jgi:hypothetical protein
MQYRTRQLQHPPTEQGPWNWKLWRPRAAAAGLSPCGWTMPRPMGGRGSGSSATSPSRGCLLTVPTRTLCGSPALSVSCTFLASRSPPRALL